jgi:hypothetical protein
MEVRRQGERLVVGSGGGAARSGEEKREGEEVVHGIRHYY